MNAVSEDIKDMLEADSSLGLTFGTDLFIGQEQSKPNDCVTIFDTMGRDPSLTLTYNSNLQNEYYEYPSCQIRVRNDDYLTGWDLINDIMLSLHGRANETWNGTLYIVIRSTGGAAMFDWDENTRVRFVCNFNLQRR